MIFVFLFLTFFHICFICSSVEGHLGGFQVLAIVNSATMNNGVQVSLNYNFVHIDTQEWDYWII